MARTIEFEGRLIEVPDDATDDEVATIISATPAPAPLPDRSVANTARTRLARRGLTPEQIKASPPSGPLPPRYSELYSGFGEMLGLDDDSGFEYKPRTTDGGYFSNLGRGLNPKEIAAGLGERGINQLLTVMDPTGGPDSLPPDERSNRGVDMTDLGVPDLPAIYQEASRRGEQGESLAGMYGSASAQALLAGAGMGAGRLIRSAPARAAAAETQYAEATGATPPVAREMIARRMVIGADPAPQAAAQRAQAAAINAERSTIPVAKPARGARGRFQPSTDPVDVANAAERSILKSRAEMETNIAQILEATPETRTALGAVGKGAGRFAKSRLTLASGVVGASTGWSPASLMSLSPVAATHLLWSISKELVKTNQWQTALPIYKTRFANALMTGNADLAAATGALIASGQGTVTNTDTPTNTSTGTSTDTDTEALSGQTGQPNQPGTRRLDWGGFTGYDEFEFGVTPEAKRIRQLLAEIEAHGPASDMDDYYRNYVGREDEAARLAKAARAKGVPHENNQLFRSTPFADLFPVMFTNVRKTFGASSITGEQLQRSRAIWGMGFNSINDDFERGANNTILTDHEESNNPFVILHEAGHGVWHKELTEPEHAEFEDLQAFYLDRRDEDKSAPIPAAMTIYEDDPGHAYASLVAAYILNPKGLRSKFPDIYATIRGHFGGTEYVDGKITRPRLRELAGK